METDDPGCAARRSRPELHDLGSQLEDLVTHALRCEKWARFDDRLDLVSLEQDTSVRRRAAATARAAASALNRLRRVGRAGGEGNRAA